MLAGRRPERQHGAGALRERWPCLRNGTATRLGRTQRRSLGRLSTSPRHPRRSGRPGRAHPSRTRRCPTAATVETSTARTPRLAGVGSRLARREHDVVTATTSTTSFTAPAASSTLTQVTLQSSAFSVAGRIASGRCPTPLSARCYDDENKPSRGPTTSPNRVDENPILAQSSSKFLSASSGSCRSITATTAALTTSAPSARDPRRAWMTSRGFATAVPGGETVRSDPGPVRIVIGGFRRQRKPPAPGSPRRRARRWRRGPGAGGRARQSHRGATGRVSSVAANEISG